MSAISSTSTVRLGTYNVHHLFDHLDDPLTRDEEITPKSDRSKEALAQVIRDSGVDVLALQEVENLEILTELRDRHGLQERFPHLVLERGNDPRGSDVAVMSRFPISEVTSHREAPVVRDCGRVGRFSRDLLQVEVLPPNAAPIRLFVSHFVSQKGGAWARAHRLAEARKVRRILDRQSASFPCRRYVLAGDFNDHPQSQTLMELTQESGSLRDPFLGALSHPTYPARPNLEKRYPPQRLDYVLLGEGLADSVSDFGVLHHPLEAAASDHRLVWVDLSLEPAALQTEEAA